MIGMRCDLSPGYNCDHVQSVMFTGSSQIVPLDSIHEQVAVHPQFVSASQAEAKT